jgi:hypothetical protein
VKITKAQLRKIIKEELGLTQADLAKSMGPDQKAYMAQKGRDKASKEMDEFQIGGLMAKIKMRVGDAQRAIAKNPEQPAQLMTPLLDKLSEEVATLQDEVTKKLSRLMTLNSYRQ